MGSPQKIDGAVYRGNAGIAAISARHLPRSALDICRT